MGYYMAGDYYMAGGKGPAAKKKHHKKHRKGKKGAAGPGLDLGAIAGGLGKLRGRRGGGGHHRMHVTNVKALRRAMRRVQGFAKLARKTIGFTHRIKMKKHRRR